MSSSFHTTIGWGMPWYDFENLTTLDCEAHATRETLDNAFTEAVPSVFEIGDEEYERALFSCEAPREIYNTPHSLYSNILAREDDTFVLGRPDELYQVIDGGEDDGPLHVVFYPDCYHARRWKRVDDELDLALLFYWENGNTRNVDIDGSPRIQYVAFGHGPWKNALMTEDGKPHDWVSFASRRADLLPRVPLEMRRYLTKLGVLNDIGVNRLRPLTARWIA